MLRWYPISWRAVHGAEFAALLEDSLAERSFWARRGFDVARRGTTLRIRLLQETLLLRPSTFAAALAVVGLLTAGWIVGATRRTLNLEVYMVPSASSSQVAAMRRLIDLLPSVSGCTYLGHEASYQYGSKIVRSEGSYMQLVPATVPTLFRCTAGDPRAAAIQLTAIATPVSGIFHAVTPLMRRPDEPPSSAPIIEAVLFAVAGGIGVSGAALSFAKRRRVA